jgi:hypothetical protein
VHVVETENAQPKSLDRHVFDADEWHNGGPRGGCARTVAERPVRLQTQSEDAGHAQSCSLLTL